MDATKLGKFISELRIENNLTQDELADKIGVSSGKIISKWEKGYTFPDFEMLIKLSEVLNVTLYELSVCEKLKKKSLIEATKHKIKSSKDILKMNIQKKITIFLAVVIGIIFGLCMIFTIDNYNTVKVYELISLDKNFAIEGSYINAKDYNAFNVISIKNIMSDKSQYNIDAYDVEYEILDNNRRVFAYNKQLSNKEGNKITNLLDIIDSSSFKKSILKDSLPKNNELIFRINYIDNDNKKNEIDFKFKLEKKFVNTF